MHTHGATNYKFMSRVSITGHAMKWKMVWNGRRILVWNMKDAQNGMEDLKNGMFFFFFFLFFFNTKFCAA